MIKDGEYRTGTEDKYENPNLQMDCQSSVFPTETPDLAASTILVKIDSF
jgi:hypothetical protein